MKGKHPNSQANLKPFVKGESGNPSGRAKAFNGIKKQLQALANDEVYKTIKVSDGFDDIDFSTYEERMVGTRKEVVLNTIWAMAEKGDKWAIELLERQGCLD